jgi:hypothetical protein
MIQVDHFMATSNTELKQDDLYMGWEVYDGETQISDSNGFGFTFKEAREWLENYLDKNEK